MSGQSYRRVGSAFSVSESSLRRHRHAHMRAHDQAGTTPEQPGEAADGLGTTSDDPAAVRTPRDGSLAVELIQRDAELRALAFSGDVGEQLATLEAHIATILRRAESRDPRTALAAAKILLAAYELRMKAGGQLAPETPSAQIVIYNGHPPTIEHQDAGVIVLLPDNGRGDAPITINGQVEAS